MAGMIVCEYLPSYKLWKEFIIKRNGGRNGCPMITTYKRHDNIDFYNNIHDIILIRFTIPYKRRYYFTHKVLIPKGEKFYPPTNFELPVIMTYHKYLKYDHTTVKSDCYIGRANIVKSAYNKFVMKRVKNAIHLHSPLYNIVEEYL